MNISIFEKQGIWHEGFVKGIDTKMYENTAPYIKGVLVGATVA